MNRTLLETNARRIKNEGRIEGRVEGIAEGIAKKGIEIFPSLLATGMSETEAQRLAEIDDNLAAQALKAREAK